MALEVLGQGGEEGTLEREVWVVERDEEMVRRITGLLDHHGGPLNTLWRLGARDLPFQRFIVALANELRSEDYVRRRWRRKRSGNSPRSDFEVSVSSVDQVSAKIRQLAFELRLRQGGGVPDTWLERVAWAFAFFEEALVETMANLSLERCHRLVNEDEGLKELARRWAFMHRDKETLWRLGAYRWHELLVDVGTSRAALLRVSCKQAEQPQGPRWYELGSRDAADGLDVHGDTDAGVPRTRFGTAPA